jgi:hypothetical protein
MRQLANTFGQHPSPRVRAAALAQPSEIMAKIPVSASHAPRPTVLAAATICVGHRKG